MSFNYSFIHILLIVICFKGRVVMTRRTRGARQRAPPGAAPAVLQYSIVQCCSVRDLALHQTLKRGRKLDTIKRSNLIIMLEQYLKGT